MRLFDAGMSIFIVIVATIFCGSLFYLIDNTPVMIDPNTHKVMTHRERNLKRMNQGTTFLPSVRDIPYTPSPLSPMDSVHYEHKKEQPLL